MPEKAKNINRKNKKEAMAKRAQSEDAAGLFALLLVVITALGGFAYLYAHSGQLSGAAVLRAQNPSNHLIISGLNLGETIGKDIAVLTKLQLNGLGDDIIRTRKRATNYQQLLLLSGTFTGGSLVHTRNNEDIVGDYLYFESSKPIFEVVWSFSPGLVFPLEDNDDDKVKDELGIGSRNYLNIFGKPYLLVEGKVSGTALTLKLFGEVGALVIEDTNINDETYADTIEINGRLEAADVRVRGTITSDKVTITSINYRPLIHGKKIGDIYISAGHGILGYLRNPAILLSNSFDIIYGGLLGKVDTKQAVTKIQSSILEFDPYGSGYYFIFTNTRGQTYKAPLVENRGGSLEFGRGSHNLIVEEGASSSDYNIALNNNFILTSSSNTNGVTNILNYDAIDYTNGNLFIDDLGGGAVSANFDKTTNKGSISVGGYSYDFYVDTAAPHSIVVDMNADGGISSDDSDIVLFGGARLELGASGDTLNMELVVPKKLFRDKEADERSAIQITSPGDEVDITVTSPALMLDKAGLKTAMSNFGILFVHDNGHPANLKIGFPEVERKTTAVKTGAQQEGIVVITTKREELIKKNS